MPREAITIQVGQCGNQVGRRFWEMALAEHSSINNPDGVFDEPMSSFFRNVDARYADTPDLPFEDGKGKICSLKARAVLVDMEEGPVTETLRGPLGELFEHAQLITDVSGAGNNFAHGHYVYGPKYADMLVDAVRRAAERCDSLQSFFLMHSLGGGTGSGLGTYILQLLEDNFQHVHRFSTAVFPSEDDDVVTSPYNSVLALQQLTNHADCVLPVENQSLMDITTEKRAAQSKNGGAASVLPPVDARRGAVDTRKGQSAGFHDMNGVLARVLMDLTASMRFAGDLNVDLNEITTNLVPYPRMHYLLSSLSPPWGLVAATAGARGGNASHHMKQICSGAFARSNQLMKADPRRGTMLACALLFRGPNISLSDVTTNVSRLQTDIKMIHWNREGFKIGLCSVPPVGLTQHQQHVQTPSASLLCLSNSCCIASTLEALEARFLKLYTRRAMLHHYTQFVDADVVETAREDLASLIEDYRGLERPKPRIPGGLSPLRFSPSTLF